MVTPTLEAAAAEAAFWLLHELRRSANWFRRGRREQALRQYLATVVKAHLETMLAEQFLPAEAEAEERLAAAIEHAVREAKHPEVAQAAARYDAELARLWRVGYTAERARRWRPWQAEPWPPHTTVERAELEAAARAEWEEVARHRREVKATEAEVAAAVGGIGSEPGREGAEQPCAEDPDQEVGRRRRLLEEYKQATGLSEYAIYTAAGRDHSCHKAEFRRWKKGELPAESATAQSLERFLAAKQAPSTPKRKISSR